MLVTAARAHDWTKAQLPAARPKLSFGTVAAKGRQRLLSLLFQLAERSGDSGMSMPREVVVLDGCGIVAMQKA
jgi:hypothetical protein